MFLIGLGALLVLGGILYMARTATQAPVLAELGPRRFKTGHSWDSKAEFNGIGGLRNPHQNCPDMRPPPTCTSAPASSPERQGYRIWLMRLIRKASSQPA